VLSAGDDEQAQQRLVQTILSEENDVAPEIHGRSDVAMT